MLIPVQRDRVDAKSLVTIRQNRYSVPVALAGLKVSARIGAREITINHSGREVARHERLHGKFGTSAQLDHYLELLTRKPGGLEHSVALVTRSASRRPARLAIRHRNQRTSTPTTTTEAGGATSSVHGGASASVHDEALRPSEPRRGREPLGAHRALGKT
jgi:hypothetical protein